MSNNDIDGIISGKITTSTISSITGNLTPIQNIYGTLNNITPEIRGAVSTPPARSSYHFYDGIYEITPTPELDIILNTSNQILLDDIVVKEIPYFEITNESGGYTVTIG